MSQFIENTFTKISDNKYKVVYRQIAYAFTGIIGAIFVIAFFIQKVSDGIKQNGHFNDVLLAVGVLIVLLVLSIVIVMGFLTTITEIDFDKRKIYCVKKYLFKQKSICETSLDRIIVSALRMGISDASPNETWITKAGFCCIDNNGVESDIAICSREVIKIQERNETMFELYRFFFPDRPAPKEEDLITNGNVLMILSEEQKKEFGKGTLIDIEPIASQNKNNKFDNLLG